tara:strand:- start:11256 stop:11825 length:570 start_codon:yes stop_codon:yes gene_type:complete
MSFIKDFFKPIAISSFVIFFIIGYLLSDDVFFKKIINNESINSPLEAFNYINKVTKDPDGSVESDYEFKFNLSSSQSPRYILTKRNYIWCDEGAVVLATFANELGYETRLVDLINTKNNVSEHTVLEIYENNNWILYDTQNDFVGVSYDESAGYNSSQIYREYPRTYNFFIQNNFFLKKIIFFLRQIKG